MPAEDDLQAKRGNRMLPNVVASLLGKEGPELVRECRRCGTPVDEGATACPHCGQDADLVSYEIP